jgi:Fe-S cluster assembly ATP-binding protein
MLAGRIVESGGAELAQHLEEHGYDWLRDKASSQAERGISEAVPEA